MTYIIWAITIFVILLLIGWALFTKDKHTKKKLLRNNSLISIVVTLVPIGAQYYLKNNDDGNNEVHQTLINGSEKDVNNIDSRIDNQTINYYIAPQKVDSMISKPQQRKERTNERTSTTPIRNTTINVTSKNQSGGITAGQVINNYNSNDTSHY